MSSVLSIFKKRNSGNSIWQINRLLTAIVKGPAVISDTKYTDSNWHGDLEVVFMVSQIPTEAMK